MMRLDAGAPSAWENKRVLVVDDEPRNVSLIETLFEPFGCKVVRAFGGTEAIEAFRRDPPDLVLLDLMMPGVNGFQVLEALRDERAARPVPVMVVTAGGDREARLRAYDLGADEFLEKPIDRAILLRRAHMLLELHEGARRLRRQNDELVALQEQQRDLTAFLVHDLKSPLAVIQYNAEWLTEELDDDADLAATLADVAGAARGLAAMVNDLLLVSRLDAGETLELTRQRIELAGLAAGLLREHEKQAVARGITLAAEIAPELGVSADAGLLRRVLTNLLENALRHTLRGGRIAIAAVRDGAVTRLTVSNTGPAIPEADRARIFEKYERAARGDRHGTVGLGLYFCRRVAESHGGAIAVDSTSDWPVRFTLSLPDRAAEDAA